jgi:hypothetical protein
MAMMNTAACSGIFLTNKSGQLSSRAMGIYGLRIQLIPLLAFCGELKKTKLMRGDSLEACCALAVSMASAAHSYFRVDIHSAIIS